jgi:SHS2 domain-containing protein
MAFRLEAPSWAELLRIGTVAVGEVVLAPRGDERLSPRPLEVVGSDREDVLVAWLNEGVYLIDEQMWLVRDARELEAGETFARGVLLGRPLDEEPDRVIKAVTYHDLSVVPGARGTPWRATVVLDL